MKQCAKCRDALDRSDHCDGSRKTCDCQCTGRGWRKWCTHCDNVTFGPEVGPCDDCVLKVLIESVGRPTYDYVQRVVETLRAEIRSLEDQLDDARYSYGSGYGCSYCT